VSILCISANIHDHLNFFYLFLGASSLIVAFIIDANDIDKFEWNWFSICIVYPCIWILLNLFRASALQRVDNVLVLFFFVLNLHQKDYYNCENFSHSWNASLIIGRLGTLLFTQVKLMQAERNSNIFLVWKWYHCATRLEMNVIPIIYLFLQTMQ